MLVVLSTLSVVGLITGAALHLFARAALDEALLSAAHATAHSAPTERWEVEHSDTPVDAWQVRRGDSRIPPHLVERARRSERPVFATERGQRLLLLTAEPPDDEHERHGEDEAEEILIAARAAEVTLARSTGPFAVIYLIIAGASAVLAGLGLARLTQHALQPLARAEAEAAAVVGLGQGARLTVDAPEELSGLLGSMNAALDRLDAAHRTQLRFTDQAAHELRTPVTVLQGEIDVALRAPRSAEDYRATLASVREEVGRMRDLVEGLLTMARLDAGAIASDREPTDAAEIAADAADHERDTLADAGCDLTVEIVQDPPLLAHRALLSTALGNLLRNAAVHAPGHPVRLALVADGGFARFEVDDQGPGVPEAERASVFDRLHRGGPARRSDRGGLGLGLPFARDVARLHGGDCWLEDRPGGGCRAVLTVPSTRTPPGYSSA